MPEPFCRHVLFVILLVAGLALVVGCGPSREVAFRLNTEGRDAGELDRARTDAVRATLAELFGTPDAPQLPDAAPLDPAKLRRAAGPVAVELSGRRLGLYRRHCAACHGISGDGAGPNAARLDPYPRDFRLGRFKYVTTLGGAKPIPGDLRRTLVHGIPGTAMPSFGRLPDDQLDALVQYVEYLAVRGEVELLVAQLVFDEGEYVPLDPILVHDEALDPVVAQWRAAPTAVLSEQDAVAEAPPDDTPEQHAASIAEGRRLYATDKAQCIKCHGPEGRGDGEESDLLFDDWNKPKQGVTPEQTEKLAGRFSLPLRRLCARDFREGAFRGGDRPIDLYWRIHLGLPGTPMPAAGPSPGVPGVLTPKEIWHLVHYVQSLANEE